MKFTASGELVKRPVSGPVDGGRRGGGGGRKLYGTARAAVGGGGGTCLSVCYDRDTKGQRAAVCSYGPGLLAPQAHRHAPPDGPPAASVPSCKGNEVMLYDRRLARG